MTKSFHIEGLGDVKVTKYKRAKRMKIRVNQQKEVNVSIPYFISYKQGIGFVREKMPWIKQTREKIAGLEKAQLLTSGFSLSFLNKTVTLQSAEISVLKITQPDQDSFIIHFPAHLNANQPEIQTFLKDALTKVLRHHAKEFLPWRVKHLAQLFGFTYEKITIKNLRSRWGSCSARNNINLNLHLVRLPLHLIDYVILHELVHTQHKNHGPHFWKALDALLQGQGNAKKLQKEMRRYTTDFTC